MDMHIFSMGRWLVGGGTVPSLLDLPLSLRVRRRRRPQPWNMLIHIVLALFAFATIPRLIVLPDMTSPYNCREHSMGIYNSAIIVRQGPCDERDGSFSKTP